jgi:hypothetical protein
MIFFIRMPDSINESLMYARQQVTLPLEFSSKRPDMSQNDSAIALLPANSISFASLPLPGRWMTLKKKYEFIRHNIPDDIIYDENNDELIIWTTEHKEIIFAIVNKTLWLHWHDKLQNVDAIIPEWQLALCPNEDVRSSRIAWHKYTLVRTAKWNGYSVDKGKNDDEQLGWSQLNMEQIFIDIAKKPLPLEFTTLIKKIKMRSYFYHALTGFLFAGVILQSLQVYTLRQEYLLSVSQRTDISNELYDGFTPLLNTLGKINDRIQFKITAMDYKKNNTKVVLLSYSDCQKLTAEFRQDNKNINMRKVQELKSVWRCMAQLDVNS